MAAEGSQWQSVAVISDLPYLNICNISRCSPVLSFTNISLSNSDINPFSIFPCILIDITKAVCSSQHMSPGDENTTTEVVNVSRRSRIFVHKGDHERELSLSCILSIEDVFSSWLPTCLNQITNNFVKPESALKPATRYDCNHFCNRLLAINSYSSMCTTLVYCKSL